MDGVIVTFYKYAQSSQVTSFVNNQAVMLSFDSEVAMPKLCRAIDVQRIPPLITFFNIKKRMLFPPQHHVNIILINSLMPAFIPCLFFLFNQFFPFFYFPYSISPRKRPKGHTYHCWEFSRGRNRNRC